MFARGAIRRRVERDARRVVLEHHHHHHQHHSSKSGGHIVIRKGGTRNDDDDDDDAKMVVKTNNNNNNNNNKRKKKIDALHVCANVAARAHLCLHQFEECLTSCNDILRATPHLAHRELVESESVDRFGRRVRGENLSVQMSQKLKRWCCNWKERHEREKEEHDKERKRRTRRGD